MEQITVQANGMSFDGLAAGPRGGELVLLLHGFPQFADSWTAVLADLAERGYRAVAIDQRGYSSGARPLAVQSYTPGGLVTDVFACADQLGARHFHLAGHDWGGLIAWAAAAQAPERVRSVTVLSTPHPDAFAAALRSTWSQRRRSLYVLLFKAPLHLAERLLLAGNARGLRMMYTGKVSHAQVEANIVRLRQGGTLTAALNWYRATRFTAARIGPVQVSALYLWGDNDPALGRVAALKTAEFCRGPYRFVELTGRTHWLLEEAPDEVTGLLAEHLASSASLDDAGRSKSPGN